MSRVRGKDTQIETVVRRFLFSKGLRFRKNDRRYPGTPDIVLAKYKTVVFVNGCFWHMHDGCKSYRPSKSNCDFWTRKLERNRQRDMDNTALLQARGWRVLVVWGCELKAPVRQERLDRLYTEITGTTKDDHSISVP